MGIEFDPALCQDPNHLNDKDPEKEKAYTKGLSWQLRTPDGVLLARAIGPRPLLNTARAMFDIGGVKNGSGKFLYLYDLKQNVCATISTKTAMRLETRSEKPKRRKKSRVPDEERLED
jgi:hypothetical protein